MAGARREEREVLEDEEGGLLRRERRSREEEEEGLREVEQLTDNMRLTARELEEEVGGHSVDALVVLTPLCRKRHFP